MTPWERVEARIKGYLDTIAEHELAVSRDRMAHDLTVIALGSPDRQVTHACPPMGSGLTPCCGQTPISLPATDRITNLPSRVTCPESTDSEATP